MVGVQPVQGHGSCPSVGSEDQMSSRRRRRNQVILGGGALLAFGMAIAIGLPRTRHTLGNPTGGNSHDRGLRPSPAPSAHASSGPIVDGLSASGQMSSNLNQTRQPTTALIATRVSSFSLINLSDYPTRSPSLSSEAVSVSDDTITKNTKLTGLPSHAPSSFFDSNSGATPTESSTLRGNAPSKTPMFAFDTQSSSIPTAWDAARCTATNSSSCPCYEEPPPLPGKKGVCMTLREQGMMGSWMENLPKVIALRPYWNYKWGLERIDAQPDDIEFVPMAFGNNDTAQLQADLEAYVKPLIENGKVKRLLGFNEPDKTEQSNMNPRLALEQWPLLQNLNISLTSPSCGNSTGAWMTDFMLSIQSTCGRVDWIGVHWYGGSNFDTFKERMESIYSAHGGRRLLITEFASADWQATSIAENQHSKSQVLNFMKQVLPWLEAQDWIAGYAWFSFSQATPQGTSSALFHDDTGELTALGKFYASVRSDDPAGNQSIVADP